MALPTMSSVLTDVSPVVGEMIPVSAASVPPNVKREFQPGAWRFQYLSTWTEVLALLPSQGGCRYGCKVYVKRVGCTTRWAVFHSRTYGH